MALYQMKVEAVSLLFKNVYYRQSSKNNEKYMQENTELSSNFIACTVSVNSNWGDKWQHYLFKS